MPSFQAAEAKVELQQFHGALVDGQSGKMFALGQVMCRVAEGALRRGGVPADGVGVGGAGALLIRIFWRLLRSRVRGVDLRRLCGSEHPRALEDAGMFAHERLQVVEGGVACMLPAELVIKLPEVVVEVGKAVLQNFC